MTDKFDPATHRFGMAYYLPSWTTEAATVSSWVYPLFQHGNRWLCAWGEPPNERAILTLHNVTRAPEHDLVPRSALQVVAVPQEVIKQAAEALKLYLHGHNPCSSEFIRDKGFAALAALEPYRKGQHKFNKKSQNATTPPPC